MSSCKCARAVDMNACFVCLHQCTEGTQWCANAEYEGNPFCKDFFVGETAHERRQDSGFNTRCSPWEPCGPPPMEYTAAPTSGSCGEGDRAAKRACREEVCEVGALGARDCARAGA
eukprot:gene1104-53259_t